MSKYRVEAHLTDSDDGTKWGPHIIEFDTEVDSRGIVEDRFQSIGAVALRMIAIREKLQPNPRGLPLAYSGKPRAN